MIVHPLNDKVIRFYSGLGFQTFQGEEPAMFLPIETIREVFGHSS